MAFPSIDFYFSEHRYSGNQIPPIKDFELHFVVDFLLGPCFLGSVKDISFDSHHCMFVFDNFTTGRHKSYMCTSIDYHVGFSVSWNGNKKHTTCY